MNYFHLLKDNSMSYDQRIRTLEEAYRVVDNQLFHLEKTESKDSDKIKQLTDAKQKYLNELRQLRRAQYESSQEVDFGDE